MKKSFEKMENNCRPGEMDALYFDKLPQKCKEMFFYYLGDGDKNADGVSRSSFIQAYGFDCSFCESPIETIFAFAVMILNFDSGSHCPTFDFESQAEIIANGNRYIADFMFDTENVFNKRYEYEKPYKLIVECDGHEFHEKTKKQVARRNKRDYDLKMAGYDIIHFSGSEIFNEPFKCAYQTFKLILANIGHCKKKEWRGN